MNKENILTLLVSAILFFIILTAYLRNICFTVLGYLHDSPSLLVAAATYGIPHGFYPLFIFLGYLFSKIPIGEVAFRLNFMSSLFAVFTSIILFYLLLFFTKDDKELNFKVRLISASITTLLFAFFEKIWIQAEYLEIHIVHTFFAGLSIFALFLFARIKSVKSFYFLCLSIGFLSIINLNGAPFFLWTFLIYLIIILRKSKFPFKNYLFGFLIFLIPFLSLIPYFYQIKNAKFNYIETFAPGMTPWFWEKHPFSSLFWKIIWHIAGWGRFKLFSEDLNKVFSKFTLTIVNPFLSNFGFVGLLLLIVGFFESFNRKKGITLVLLSTTIFWIFSILSLGFNEHMDEQLLPIWTMLFLWLGLGLNQWFNLFWQKEFISRKNEMKLSLFIISFLPISLLLNIFQNGRFKSDFRNCQNWRIEAYETIKSYPKDAVLATAWGSPLNYFLIIEKVRPDIRIYPGYANIRSRINELKRVYGKKLIIEKSWVMENW